MDAPRLLDAEVVRDFDTYVSAGGGSGLDAARRMGGDAVIEEVEASGLRGRGGAGFPTGRKWRTVAGNRSPALPSTVVVNAAEGEPGTFKDRVLIRTNPYRILEGALIAALAVGADRVVVAAKASFRREIDRLREATNAVAAAGWGEGVDMAVVEGPEEYLFGEETALLEAVDGRPPFPRIAPPYRHGVDEVGDEPGPAAGTEMAAPGGATVAPPTLANNVETLANVPGILTTGPAWFRELGTAESPGTILCTVTGRTRRHGLGEFPMGTPLQHVLEEVGEGPEYGHGWLAAMSGVANPLLPASQFATPVSYEGMQAAGTALGAAGFIVFDDTTDPVAVARGVARFLAVESCGQCTPCKQDGLALADLFARVCRSEVGAGELTEIEERVRAVTDGARCYLAHQQQRVLSSILRLFPQHVAAHVDGGAETVGEVLIAPIVELEGGRAQLDERHLDKQPDWTFDETDSGKSPADRYGDVEAPPA